MASAPVNPQDLNPQDLRSFLFRVRAEHPATSFASGTRSRSITRRPRSRSNMRSTAAPPHFEKSGARVSRCHEYVGARARFAAAIGVAEDELIARWSGNDVVPVTPKLVKTGPVLDVVLKGADVDLDYLPIMRHFVQDGGSYLTNAMFIAKDPETGVRNASFHRLQRNGKTRLEPAFIAAVTSGTTPARPAQWA